MKTLPDLDDKAVVKLSRQGGVAAIHALTRPREIEFAQCDIDQRTRICSVLEGCLPLTSSTPGRGDQRYFQIEVRYRANDRDDEMVLQVPEDRAPGELVHLWDKGEVL
ncbi:hypothetical protein J3P80_15000 [Pseudomonas sp. D2-30]|uniref:protealysin inhibitor emfourin n=1 Tax=unclassified Pseudomonas TaxID=196821 RepID=UPI003DA9CC0C